MFKNHYIHKHLNGTPFPAQWTADKLLPPENLLHHQTSQHTHTLTTPNTHTHTRLFCTFTLAPFICSLYVFTTFLHYCFFFIYFFFNFLSPPGRKSYRMKSMCGAGMIGQWEAGCHWNYVCAIHTHTQGVGGGRWRWKNEVYWSLGHPVFTLSHCILIIEECETCTDRFINDDG